MTSATVPESYLGAAEAQASSVLVREGLGILKRGGKRHVAVLLVYRKKILKKIKGCKQLSAQSERF